MSEQNIIDDHKINQDLPNQTRGIIEMEKLEKILSEMVVNSDHLKNGFKIISEYEIFRNFHFGLLTVIFNNLEYPKLYKLTSSIVNIFIRKNWG